jgi:hypothetical protein
MPWSSCAECGTPIPPPTGRHGRPRRFCCRRCGWRSAQRTHRAAHRRPDLGAAMIRELGLEDVSLAALLREAGNDPL